MLGYRVSLERDVAIIFVSESVVVDLHRFDKVSTLKFLLNADLQNGLNCR